MKRAYFFMAGFLAVLMLGAIVPVHAADPDTLYVRYIEGTVRISEAGSAQAMEAVVNTPLIEGDAIATGPNGRAELFLKDGSMVRVGKSSALRITGINDRGIQFNLQQGTVYVVSRGSREVPIFFETPRASLDISSPSTVRIDAYSNGINEVSVLKGSIFASDRSGRMLVRQGERLVLKTDGTMPAVAALRAPDEWLQWNSGRDGATIVDAAAGDSYAYLPEELRTYSPDLDANGQWIYTPEYEYVWVPTVIVAGTWSPYRYGRWGWIGGNYVWIGFEPWGWVPYHYGRWVHHGRAGWCWVPPRHRDVRWEPAHVAWVHSSRQVSWVPLAPGERYDRRTAPAFRQARAFNVPYNNATIERSAAAARTSYRNAAVANSMVTVERDRMLSQRTMNVTAGNKSALTLRKVGLPANITPVHAPGRPVGAQIAPVPQVSAAPHRVSGTGSKDIPGGGTNSPPATTRQFSGTSLSSRIENARNSGNRDAQPGPGKTNVPDVQKGPAPSYGPTVTPLRERIQTANSPAAKRDTKLASQPGGLGNTMNVRSTAVASQPPAPPSLPRETNRAPVGPTLADPPQAGKTPATHGLNAGRPGAPGNPTSIRAISVQPPAREPAQAVRVNTVNPAPSANQATRPAFTEKRSSPVVSAAPQPSSGSRPVAPRQSVTRSEPVKNPAPQAVHQPQAAPVRTSPAPQAAAPSKPAPAPAQPAKNDHKAGPGKNNNKPQA